MIAVRRVEESGLREVGSRSRRAVKQQNPIDDCATRVATRRSEGQIVQLQRRQTLAIVRVGIATGVGARRFVSTAARGATEFTACLAARV